MSLDLWLSSKPCLTCGDIKQTEIFNYTYNVWPMWNEIFQTHEMVNIDNLTGAQSIVILNYASRILRESPFIFKKMNPPNGWGSYEGFIEYIETLIKAAKEHPAWVWYSDR